MSDEKLVFSQRPGGTHHDLNTLAGEWAGLTQTWFEPDKLADTQSITASLRPILDGRFLLYEYQSRLIDQARDGLALIGYNLGLERYEIAWVDTVHMGTGIMFSVGEPGNAAFAVASDYPAGEGPPWGWRTQIVSPEPDQLVITMFNVPPGGKPYKGVETTLIRSTA